MSSRLQHRLNLKSLAFIFVALLIALIWFLYQIVEAFTGSMPSQNSNSVVEFAGKYYMGDGLGMNCSFEIDPDSTFNISWSSDRGHKVNYKGSISFADGQYVLTPTNEPGALAVCFHRTFIPIDWGERKYLLPNDDDEISKYITSTFCKNVKNGDEPRDDIYGFIYLRTTDITIDVIGFPRRQDGRLQCPVFAYGQ